jgi:hypothetical protein
VEEEGMRRIGLSLALVAAAASLAAWATAGTNQTASTPTPPDQRDRQASHIGGGPVDTVTPALATRLAAARLATAKYVTKIGRARADGYRVQITQMVPDMGFHFLNPKVHGFDVSKPPILVYLKRGGTWQLAAFEWVFRERPKTRPLPGATYGSFGAACHYVDGTFVFEHRGNPCAMTSPKSGAPFSFWHPDLVTLHVWLWYPNPDGIYAEMNPLVHPFNAG